MEPVVSLVQPPSGEGRLIGYCSSGCSRHCLAQVALSVAPRIPHLVGSHSGDCVSGTLGKTVLKGTGALSGNHVGQTTYSAGDQRKRKRKRVAGTEAVAVTALAAVAVALVVALAVVVAVAVAVAVAVVTAAVAAGLCKAG